MTDIFGPVFSADHLDNAVTATLKLWFSTYLREIELQNGLPDRSLELPKSWNVRPENDRFAEEALPAVLVVSAGTADPPVMEGDGSYRGFFRVGVALYLTAPSKDTVNRNTKLYAAVVRAILLQKRSLGGVSEGCVWESEVYDEITSDMGRTAGLSVNQFVFTVSPVVNRLLGPAQPEPPDPDTLPGSQLHDVESVFVHPHVRSTKIKVPPWPPPTEE